MIDQQFKVSLPSSIKVDMTTRTISGVVIAEILDNPKDARKITIDEAFIADFVAMANEMPSGLKVELDHNQNGTFRKLGKINNVRAAESKIVGDLTIYESADLSPIYPKMGEYILSSVAEDAESYMLSMKVGVSQFYAEVDGESVELKQNKNRKGEISYTTAEGDTYDGKVNMKLAKIFGVDVVAEGALTDSMFNADTKPAAEKNVIMTALQSVVTALSGDSKEIETFKIKNTDLMSQVESLNATIVELQTAATTAEETIATHVATIETQATTIATQLDTITELEQRAPAEVLAGEESEKPSAKKVDLMTQRAIDAGY